MEKRVGLGVGYDRGRGVISHLNYIEKCMKFFLDTKFEISARVNTWEISILTQHGIKPLPLQQNLNHTIKKSIETWGQQFPKVSEGWIFFWYWIWIIRKWSLEFHKSCNISKLNFSSLFKRVGLLYLVFPSTLTFHYYTYLKTMLRKKFTNCISESKIESLSFI